MSDNLRGKSRDSSACSKDKYKPKCGGVGEGLDWHLSEGCGVPMSLKVMVCKQDGSPIWQTGIATKNKSGMNFKCQQNSWVMSDANKGQI